MQKETAVRLVKTVEDKLPSLKPADQQSEQSAQEFRGFDLTSVPRTTLVSHLPDLWEERPEGSQSYEIRKNVISSSLGLDGTVYYLPEKKRFYVQKDPVGSSTLTFYGPIDGDPNEVLNLSEPNTL